MATSIFRKDPRPNSKLYPARPFFSDPALAGHYREDKPDVQGGGLPVQPEPPPRNEAPFRSLKGR